MPEISQPKFEYSALERDIRRLSQEVKEHRAIRPEMPEKELVKSVLGVRIQTQITTEPPQTKSSDILPEYLQKESPEIQLKVEELIELAFQKGVDDAIKEAKKYGPFILDSLHDALTTKIYDELKARKLL